RVVREDPGRRGLLYAGTEFGVFVSFDDGRRWQSFQLDLPVSPVTDLRVHRQDLVVATQGRSIWILDDLTPLHELGEEVAASGVHLYRPRDAYRMDVSGYRGQRAPEAPAQGALFRYYLREKPAGPVTLEVLDEDGTLVRSFSSDGEAAEPGGFAPFQEESVPAERGMNAFVWNLHHPPVDQPADLFVWGYVGGARAVPGTYRVRLTAGGRSVTRPFEVRADPRLEGVGLEDLEEQLRLATAVRDTMNSIYDAVRTIRDLREQVEGVSARMAGTRGRGEPSTPGAADDRDRRGISRAADSLVLALTTMEETLVQPRIESSQDVDNFSPQLDNEYAHRYGVVALPDARPTSGSYERFDDLNREWAALRGRYRALLREAVPAFNRRLEAAGVRPVGPG
ncbi:MAG TPA: hypothetical protein VLL48_07830, partial [Longimicrobiales bacterium]|nr:hypothetical protein [Longimicrobiales bacterium]